MIGRTKTSRIRISPDKIKVLIDYDPRREVLEQVVEEVIQDFKNVGLSENCSPEQLKSQIETWMEENKSSRGIVVLEGTPPVAFEDGKIEWARDFFSKDFVEDEKTRSINYREREGCASVQEEELLARVIPPRGGKPGLDVFGKSIAPASGRKADIKVGGSVRKEMDDEVLSLFSTVCGRVRWQARKLSVDKVYVINGSVGLETGNISHPGTVVVRGDIESGSRVEAEGNIDVQGTIEAAEVISGGSLTVKGGVAGGGNCRIRIQGQLFARFLQDANVETGEDVNVEKEILHSTVKTRGAVNMPNGKVLGGELFALQGIEVMQAGGLGVQNTVLATAVDYRLVEKIESIQQELSGLKRDYERIQAALEPLLPRERLLKPKRRMALKALKEKVEVAREAIREREEKIEQLESESRSKAVEKITVSRVIHSQTTLRIRNRCLRVSELKQGPLQATLDSGDVVLEAYSAGPRR